MELISKVKVQEIVFLTISNSLDVEVDKSPDCDLEDDLGADSMHITEIVSELECEMSVDISDKESLSLRTPRQVVYFIVEKIKNGKSSKFKFEEV